MNNNYNKRCNSVFFLSMVACFSLLSLDASAAATTIAGMASNVNASLTEVAKMIVGASYVAGIGFSVGAVMKFKQHKDNPTQIPIGTPIALLFIAAALLFLPTIVKIAGYSMFGTGATAASVTGGKIL